MAALKLGYFRANPSAADQVGKLTKRAANYLAHEYLNAAWSTFYSTDVADEMAAGKLTFLASATLMENHLELMLTDAAAAYLKKQPTDRLRQLTQDFLTGQRFRRDVFVRGHPHLPRAETLRYLRNACFALPGPVEDFGEKTKVPRGEISFDQKSAQTIKDALAKGAMSLEQIIEDTGAKKNLQELERTILLMTAVGKLVPVGSSYQPGNLPAKPERVRIVDAINRNLIKLGRQSVSRQYLVAPAVGSGLAIDALDAVGLALLEEGTPVAKLTAAVSEELKRRGIRVNKDGTPIADEKEAEAKTSEIVGRFVSRALPTLMRYGVVEAV
jgi:hypothetical protein